MNKTKIEWAKNPDGTPGYTWNPITGCLNHVMGMCKGGNFPCYAYRLANTRLKEIYLLNPKVADVDGQLRDSQSPLWNRVVTDPFYPRFWPERLKELDCFSAINEPNFLKRLPRKERGVFVCDMSDLFGIGIPENWTRDILDTIYHASMHRFYLLTKQPQNLIKFSPFPDNCWVGVTATDMPMFRQAMKGLIDIQAKVKYISFEPLLEEVFVDPISFKGFYEYANMPNTLIDWVIIGAQTKPYKPPKIEWVREIVEACDKAGIPVFLKDNLKPLMLSELFSTKQWAWSGNKLRQEMPEGK